MEPQRVRKTYKYRLYPTPEQERVLDTILWRCRARYNVALEERKTAWERRGVSLNYYHQANELPDLKAACPEYGEVHSQVLQDVLKRLERTYQGFFRRIRDGGRQGIRATRVAIATAASPIPNTATARRWMVGYSRSLALAEFRSRCIDPLRAHPRRSRSDERVLGGMWRSPAPTFPSIHCP
jgi:putative transposase